MDECLPSMCEVLTGKTHTHTPHHTIHSLEELEAFHSFCFLSPLTLRDITDVSRFLWPSRKLKVERDAK